MDDQIVETNTNQRYSPHQKNIMLQNIILLESRLWTKFTDELDYNLAILESMEIIFTKGFQT